MSAVDDVFAQLHKSGKTAFMPFITAGDPDLDFTAACLQRLDSVGCHLIELGIPYSDPIADGPTIQASYTRALSGGAKLDAIFEMVGRISPELRAPILCMVSYAIIFRLGIDAFLKRAQAAGFAGAIVPDLPVDEADELAETCRQADFCLVQLITPTTPPARVSRIASKSTGFIYYVSVTGITGERTRLPDDLVQNLRSLREQTDLPVCVGFGIAQPEHAQLLQPVADGVIVGSAIVKRMAEVTEATREDVLNEISRFANTMLEAV